MQAEPVVAGGVDRHLPPRLMQAAGPPEPTGAGRGGTEARRRHGIARLACVGAAAKPADLSRGRADDGRVMRPPYRLRPSSRAMPWTCRIWFRDINARAQVTTICGIPLTATAEPEQNLAMIDNLGDIKRHILEMK